MIDLRKRLRFLRRPAIGVGPAYNPRHDKTSQQRKLGGGGAVFPNVPDMTNRGGWQ